VLLLNESFVITDLDVKTFEEVITIMADRLHQGGAVCKEYAAYTIAREKVHPTGLPTKPFCIAFPHADADGVNQSALSVATLKSPVVFMNMGDPEEELDVELVIMLANKNPEEQIQTLRGLALLFGKPEKLAELKAITEPSEITAWLKRELIIG